MKIRTEVIGQRHIGDAAIVKLGNCAPVAASKYSEYSPDIEIRVPLSKSKAFPLGRVVAVRILVSK